MIRRLFSAFIIIGFCLGVLFAFNHTAAAQTGSQLQITAIDPAQFPTLTVRFEAYNAQGQFIPDVQAAELTVLENDGERAITQLELIKPGVQFTLAVNAGSELTRSYAGQTHFQTIFQHLGDWVLKQTDPTTDQFSLATNSGLQVIRLADPAEWAQAINALADLNLQQEVPDLNSISRALELTTDPAPQNGMKRAVLWVTPLFTPETLTALSNLGDLATQQGVKIYLWLVATQSAVDAAPELYQAFQEMASVSGGQLTLFTGAETLPEIDSYLGPLRYYYELQFTSQTNQSGSVPIQLDLRRGDEQVQSSTRTVDLSIAPPNPIFLSPQTTVERVWAPVEGSRQTQLTPLTASVSIVVEFPDGYPRMLVASRLFIDETLVSENTAEPFDTFTWDLTQLTESGQHTMRAEVEDSLGLIQTTIDVPVNVTVEVIKKNWLQDILSGSEFLVALAIIVAGVVLVAVLFFNGRGGQQTRLKRKMRNEDPLTQPVPEHREKSSRSRKTIPSVDRPTWPRSAMAGLSSAPAWLVRLPDADSSTPTSINTTQTTASAIPLSRREVTLGSDPKRANFSIKSPSVSELHARIVQTPEGSFQIFDAGSVAGTWLNYGPVPAAGLTLHHGDIIHLGQAVFRFELANPPEDSGQAAEQSTL